MFVADPRRGACLARTCDKELPGGYWDNRRKLLGDTFDKEISKPKPQPNGQVIVELQNPADYIWDGWFGCELKR